MKSSCLRLLDTAKRLPYDLSDNLIKLPDNLLESVNHLARTGKRIENTAPSRRTNGDNRVEITGSTTVYAIAADPIAHVRTPQRLNALLRERGADGVMVPFHVSPDGLPALFAGLRGLHNLGGLVVTVPHKEQAAVLCDEITPAARLIGAVNAIRLRDGKLAGGNFDGAGLRGRPARPGPSPPAAASTWPAWAAGKAIACALADAGPARLNLYNRSPNAPANSPRLSAAYPALDIQLADAAPGADCEIAVNATSLGLSDTDPLPFPSMRCPPARRGRRRDEPRRHAAAARRRRALAARRPAHAGRTDRRDCPLPGHTGAALGSAPPARSLDPRIHHTPVPRRDTHEVAFTTGLLCLAGIASAQAAPVKIGLIETLSGPQASTGLIFRAAVSTSWTASTPPAAGTASRWNWSSSTTRAARWARPTASARRRRDPGAGFLVRDLRPADRRRAQSTTCAIRASAVPERGRRGAGTDRPEVPLLPFPLRHQRRPARQGADLGHVGRRHAGQARLRHQPELLLGPGHGRRHRALRQQYGYEVVGKTLHEVNKIRTSRRMSRASARPIPTPSSPATGPTTCCC